MQSNAQRQRKYRAAHREEVSRRERTRRSGPEVKAAEARYSHTHLNERNNRLGWKRLHAHVRRPPSRDARANFSFVSLDQLRNPSFRTVGLGYRRREFLHDPLPGAHTICANLPMSAGG